VNARGLTLQPEPGFRLRATGIPQVMKRIDIRNQTGAVGWLLIGVLIGIFLVFYAVFALIF
jgi:hypothetical protein